MNERESDGDDTLFITVSEEIKNAAMTGNTCLLIKNDGTVVTLTIISAIEKTEDTIRLIIQDEGARSPSDGDSIRFNPSGQVQDLFGNYPHEKNRAVPILVIKRPGLINNAYYIDYNADGVVDSVKVTFDRAISIGDPDVALFWRGTTSTIDSSMISYTSNDHSGISIAVPQSLKSANTTSGSMEVRFVFTTTKEITRLSTVNDSAAPVIVSATYCPGIGSASDNTPDTLETVFSESIDDITTDRPFRFIQGSDLTNYTMQLNSRSHGGATWYFIVSSIDNVSGYPSLQDSVYIDPAANLQDTNANIQSNSRNKRVLLKIKQIPFDYQILTGPNPFNPGKDSILIRIRPSSQIKEYISIKTELRILDSFGNELFNQQKETDGTSAAIDFIWNGQNEKGRLVGAGTYIGLLKVYNVNAKATTIMIGVKR